MEAEDAEVGAGGISSLSGLSLGADYIVTLWWKLFDFRGMRRYSSSIPLPQ